ncbi:MAG: ferredoxin-thioredoxin reductase catalytic domain-containing protein [Smithellaceae bacterium]|nr:ferredoxin-thioredoxin reductase catalytic domain-containing protein [Smithellaceae bacterium]
MTPADLYDLLKKAQEPKGYFFNKDKDWVLSILQDLLINKERYGYSSCPCRLASGNRENDRDIMCPCVYRTEDVKEYGSCYCNLYVTQKWNDDNIPHRYVPERRPPDKIFSSLLTNDPSNNKLHPI